jgi:hypothetical protein
MLVLGGCGGGERRDAGVADRTYPVEIERATFLPRQHLAQRNALVIAVRNAGQEAIPNLTVTVHGFAERSGGPRNADLGRDLWIVDRGPEGAASGFEDTWSTGRLAPGKTATLRWEVTPVVAGTHKLTYDIAATSAGSSHTETGDGEQAGGSLTVRVTDKPAAARVDPRTGEVRRQE